VATFNNLIQEIIVTETNYVSDLRVIEEVRRERKTDKQKERKKERESVGVFISLHFVDYFRFHFYISSSILLR
jgi:hypothetical protein